MSTSIQTLSTNDEQIMQEIKKIDVKKTRKPRKEKESVPVPIPTLAEVVKVKRSKKDTVPVPVPKIEPLTTPVQKGRKMSEYNLFVKSQYSSVAGGTLPEKMKTLSALWAKRAK